MFWGISESLNLFDEYTKAIKKDVDTLNILLFGSGDLRNILHTVGKSFKHQTKLNFYVLDGCGEIVARNMLLLLLAFEKPDVLSLRNKTHMFMDIYGNTLIRPFSSSYVTSKSSVLEKIVTDENEKNKIIPIFNIENLKYRDRDNLENTFLFYKPSPDHIFNITEYWENRIRQAIGIRYDHREGVYDWDLTMNLRDSGAKQITTQEYKHWRETGIAFTFPEYEQCHPNKTFVAGLAKNGTKFLHRGYLGEQDTGPFCAHGIKCSQAEMLKDNYGQRDYRATDITERNLYEIFYEIQNKTEYVFDKSHCHKLGSNILLLTKPLPHITEEAVSLKRYDEPSLPLENITINFLSTASVTNFTQDETKFTEFFDIAFVSHNYFPLLSQQDLKKSMKENALVIFETKQYSLLKDEQKSNFMEKIKNFAQDINLKNVTNFNININYSVVKFKNEKE